VIAFLQQAALVCAIAALSCIAVRWLVPSAARLVLAVIEQCLALVCAALLLPEFWVSNALRKRGERPPHLAYAYANTVAGAFRFVRLSMIRGVRGLAKAARLAPLPLVAIAVGGMYVGLMR
jgi:hypothetical protein